MIRFHSRYKNLTQTSKVEGDAKTRGDKKSQPSGPTSDDLMESRLCPAISKHKQYLRNLALLDDWTYQVLRAAYGAKSLSKNLSPMEKRLEMRLKSNKDVLLICELPNPEHTATSQLTLVPKFGKEVPVSLQNLLNEHKNLYFISEINIFKPFAALEHGLEEKALRYVVVDACGKENQNQTWLRQIYADKFGGSDNDPEQSVLIVLVASQGQLVMYHQGSQKLQILLEGFCEQVLQDCNRMPSVSFSDLQGKLQVSCPRMYLEQPQISIRSEGQLQEHLQSYCEQLELKVIILSKDFSPHCEAYNINLDDYQNTLDMFILIDFSNKKVLFHHEFFSDYDKHEFFIGLADAEKQTECRFYSIDCLLPYARNTMTMFSALSPQFDIAADERNEARSLPRFFNW